MTWVVGSSTSLASQIASTTSEHVWSDSHTSSNLNGLEMDWISRPAISIHSGLWFKDFDLRWWTFVPANLKSQSLVAKARSSLSHIEWPAKKCFCHVYQEPEKPRSINPHSFTTSRNSCIRVWLLLLPPNFLELLMISLKSLAHSQGRLNLLWRCRSLFHDLILLCVTGSP